MAGVAASLALVLSGMLAAACATPPVSPPSAGEPGAAGPCGVTQRSMVNTRDWRHALVLAEPTGDGEPWTGGRCDDDDRPVALIAHGYLGNFVDGYQGLVDHLVGAGFVVAFPGYTIEFDPAHQYRVVDDGFVQAVAASGRADTSRVGVIGHSFGGGMSPWLVQRAAARGWGADAFWLVDMAPHYSWFVGTGPIAVPDDLRVTVVSYDEDLFVDTRIATETFRALDVPAAQKRHVLLRSDRSGSPARIADHLGPVSVELVDGLGTISTDHFDHWATYRIVDATAGCTLGGAGWAWCGTDLSDVGTWPDGRPVRPAVVGTPGLPVADVGPPALQECEFFLNPRPCP
jgi:hypothetical protein